MYIAHIDDNNNIQSCFEHSMGTSNICGRHLKVLNLENVGRLCGQIHDIGKFTDEFSDYITRAHSGEKVIRGSIIHSFAAIRLILDGYSEKDESEKLAREIIAYSAGSHHGLFDCYDNGEFSFNHRMKKQPKFNRKAIKNFYGEGFEKAQIDALIEKSVVELKQTINKIISSSKKEEVFFYLGLLTRMVTSALIDADRRDTAEFMTKTKDFGKCLNRELTTSMCEEASAYINNFPSCRKIDKARRELSRLCEESAKKPSGIYRLNLPTGAGKTLSGLRYALNHAKEYNKDRIFIVAPLLSIIEQNSNVIKDALKSHNNCILEHHTDIIKNEATQEWSEYDLLCETWDSPITITTLVQFLNTLFSEKTSSVRRFYSLCNSIIVFDEVQSVPTKMLTIFNLALNFLCEICGCTVILCSATQPEFGESEHKLKISADLLDSSEIAKFDKIFKRNSIVNSGDIKLSEIPKFIEKLAKNNNNVLIVCNKKAQSSEIASTLSIPNTKIFHLSAAMCTEHRKKVVENMKNAIKNNEKIVCVSTQVIEAGVDISFDAVIRLSAGMDSIVQSAGRCNRNAENGNNATVHILSCIDENLSHLTDIRDSKRATESLLEIFKNNPEEFDCDLASAKAISYYYKKLYSEKNQNYFDYVTQKGKSIYSMLSDNIELVQSYEYMLHQSFKTAGELFDVIDTDSISIIVPYENSESVIERLKSENSIAQYSNCKYTKIKKLLAKAKPFTISVMPYQIEKLYEIGAVERIFDGKIFILTKDFYNDRTGLNITKEVCESWNTLIL